MGGRSQRAFSKFALSLLLTGGTLALGAGLAQAASWHLLASFGRRGVAGLPVRERGAGSLLASGAGGSTFVGGYANASKGAFRVAELSSGGRLLRSFGSGGVLTVPAIYAYLQDPPRLFSLPDGKLLIVGLDRADHLTAVRLTPRGRPDPHFGRRGVAQYTLPHPHGFALITAAALLRDGDLLAAYQKEVPPLINEQQIPQGLGEGALTFVRLTPAGALERSFGKGGYLTATGHTPELSGYPGSGLGWSCAQTITTEGSLLLSYENAAGPTTAGQIVPAVQQISPTGTDAPIFGDQGAVFLPFVPEAKVTSSSLCDGLFTLPGGGLEAGFGGEGGSANALVNLFRFTPGGALDPSFAGSGHMVLTAPIGALALAGDGETFWAARSGGALVLGGVLPRGLPDPALAGARGERFPAGLSGRVPGSEAEPSLEILPTGSGLSVRSGEELLQLRD